MLKKCFVLITELYTVGMAVWYPVLKVYISQLGTMKGSVTGTAVGKGWVFAIKY